MYFNNVFLLACVSGKFYMISQKESRGKKVFSVDLNDGKIIPYTRNVGF